jgi:hypothetical protein
VRGDAERIELRACNETGANMTRFSWASTEDKPLRFLECTDYRESDANVCDETSVAFDIDGETYWTQRTDCYASDYGVTYGRWTVHVTIGSTELRRGRHCDARLTAPDSGDETSCAGSGTTGSA